MTIAAKSVSLISSQVRGSEINSINVARSERIAAVAAARERETERAALSRIYRVIKALR